MGLWCAECGRFSPFRSPCADCRAQAAALRLEAMGAVPPAPSALTLTRSSTIVTSVRKKLTLNVNGRMKTVDFSQGIPPELPAELAALGMSPQAVEQVMASLRAADAAGASGPKPAA